MEWSRVLHDFPRQTETLMENLKGRGLHPLHIQRRHSDAVQSQHRLRYRPHLWCCCACSKELMPPTLLHKACRRWLFTWTGKFDREKYGIEKVRKGELISLSVID